MAKLKLIAYSNKRLQSIRERDNFGGAQAGRLGVATALKNVGDTYEMLLASVDEGQAKNDCSEAIKDINHIIARLEAIKVALLKA